MAKLTTATVDKLVRDGTEKMTADDACTGLYLQISGLRRASWVLRYQLDGKRKSMGLGGYPTAGLAEARDRAREKRKLLADGVDPLEYRQSERSKRQAENAKRYTMAQLITEYVGARGGGWSGWTTYSFNNNMKNHVLPIVGNVLVRDINKSLVRRILDPIWLAKPATSRLVQGYLAQLLEYAEFFELRVGNPARGIQKYLPAQPPRGHRKDLLFEEVPTFMRQLREYQDARVWYPKENVDRDAIIAAWKSGKPQPDIAAELGRNTSYVWRSCHPERYPPALNFYRLRAYALEFLILTGPPRANEVLLTLWQDIDEEQKIMVIPRARMKIKKRNGDFIVPLSTRAFEIVQELKTIRRSDYLFPGIMKRPSTRNILKDVRPIDPNAEGRPMCLTSLDYFLRENFGRTNINAHGFRKTFSNWAHASGRFRDIAIELSLDHAYGTQISRIYRDEQLVEERREMLQAWSNYCDGTSADVIRLPVRSKKRKVTV